MGLVEQLALLRRGRDEVAAHFEPGAYIRGGGLSLGELWKGELPQGDDYTACAVGCLYVAFARQVAAPDDKWQARRRLDDAAGRLFPRFRLPVAVPVWLYQERPVVTAAVVLDTSEGDHATVLAIDRYLDGLGCDTSDYFGIEAVAEYYERAPGDDDPRQGNVLACFDHAIAALEREVRAAGERERRPSARP